MIDPAFLMGAGALFTAVAGFFLSRRGQKDTARQNEAAHVLQTRVQAFEELEAVIERLREENADARKDADEARARERAARDECDRRERLQHERCKLALDRALEVMTVLQQVVVDEVARAAAGEQVHRVHVHQEDHDVDGDPTTPG